MKFESILWLNTSIKNTIEHKIIENLNLEEVYEQLLSNDEILYSLCMDIQTIEFRQAILKDFMMNEGLLDELIHCLEEFYKLKPLYHSDLYKVSNLYRIIDMLITMEKAITSLEELDQILRYYTLESTGLVALRNGVAANLLTNGYKSMKSDLKEIHYIFNTIKGATLSVSMTSGMRPKFAQVTQVDSHQYRYPKAFRHVSDALADDQTFLDRRVSSYVPVFKVQKMNYNILEEIEYALRDHKEKLETFIKAYERVDIKPFIQLYEEIAFYSSSYQLFKKMEEKGLPITKPEIVQEESCLEFTEGYNINLAIKDTFDAEAIVLNEFHMDANRKYFLMTGANRGGKTTYTQCIGQIQLMGQLGLFVPAKTARISLVDTIQSHFPALEKESIDKGKFGRECELFVENFKRTTGRSLMLLNESFAGTSHLESLSVATQGVLAMMKAGTPFVFNTHLHELYDEVLGELSQKDLKHLHNGLISMTTKMEHDKSTYFMIEQEPLGKSYAREIALKYGVTYEQLIKDI
jgi:DNA mismatch repair ATPase MutS